MHRTLFSVPSLSLYCTHRGSRAIQQEKRQAEKRKPRQGQWSELIAWHYKKPYLIRWIGVISLVNVYVSTMRLIQRLQRLI